MSPDEPAVSDAPLRFGDRSKSGESERDEERDELSSSAMPAGPPPLREAAHEPEPERVERNGRADRDERDEPKTSGSSPVVVADAPRSSAPPPTDLAGMRRRERKQVAKRRARKVKRIVRRLDAWSVLKVAFIFNLCAYIVSMVAGVVLWRVAEGAGVIENIESFIEDLGAFETYRFEPDLIFEAFALGGAVLAVLATGLIALGAVLFNLISDLVGGIRMTVIEEPGSMPARRRKSGGKGGEAPATVSGPSTEK